MERIDRLDHGYCALVETWGSDERIIEAARMSTNKGFQGWGAQRVEGEDCTGCDGRGKTDDRGSPIRGQPFFDTKDCSTCGGDGVKRAPGDEKLLGYLYRNKHSTPFEMAGLTIEVKAPIFVFRQWHRHRTQSYNEMSARYTPLPNQNYIPTVERLMANATKNKQAGKVAGAGDLTEDDARIFQQQLERQYTAAEETYQDALRQGVPKELARLGLPVARYSRMRASANLRNWLGFLTLRLDPHAQYEVRVYAEAIGAFIQNAFPRTWELFIEGAGLRGDQ